MGITCRKYKNISDYKKICDFLEKTYSSYGTKFYHNITLFEFQCALSLGMGESVQDINEVLNEVFLWFNNEELVGILEDDIFCIAADYRYIFSDIVDTRENLDMDKNKNIEWSIYEGDTDFENVLIQNNYHKTEEYWVRRDIDLNTFNNFSTIPSDISVELISNLKEYDNLYIAYKLCYGTSFNKNIIERFYKTSTYRKELDLVALGPDDKVIALCSGRYDEKNKLVTIEAVSCYHDYRKKGISKALLLHELNIAKGLGANKATIFTAMPEKYPAPNKLYESVGFKNVGNLYVWKKNI